MSQREENPVVWILEGVPQFYTQAMNTAYKEIPSPLK